MNEKKSNAFYKKRVGDYELCEVLGEGTFATVRRARHVKSGLEFAVKCLDKQKIEKQRMGKQLKREASCSQLTFTHTSVPFLPAMAGFLILDLLFGLSSYR